MDELEARTQAELDAILSVLMQLTGLPTRWSGRVEIVPNADFKGQKRQMCDIQIDAGLASRDERWSTLIHELLHSLSAGYNSNDFREYRGWEEGVVEQLQRMFRPVILRELGVKIADEVFDPLDATHSFNGFIAALETLRAADHESDPFGRIQREFYLDLLAIPIRNRPDCVLRSILALEPLQRSLFVSTFSRANSLLRARII